MSVDFVRAWQITRSVEREYHHNKCSYNSHCMLCDCEILMAHKETTDKKVMYGKDGIDLYKPTIEVDK